MIEKEQSSITSKATRFHSLDAYRAFAMLGGVLIHSAMGYTGIEIKLWPVANPDGHISFTLLIFLMHAFRLQAFFLMAGFFAALLRHRRGTSNFIRNRLRKIVVPFLLCCATVVPLTQAIFVWGFDSRGYPPKQVMGQVEFQLVGYHGPVTDFFATGRFLHDFCLFHLWFLWYLIWIYAIWLAGILLFRLARRAISRPAILASSDKPTEAPGIIRTCWPIRISLPVLLAFPTMLLMKPMLLWQVDSPYQFWPEPIILAYYFLFFTVGLHLYRWRESMPELTTDYKLWLVAALFLAPIMLWLQTKGPTSESDYQPTLKPIAIAVYSIFSWTMVLGLLGWFERYLNKPRALIRYLAQSSYWQYLMHLPVLVLVQLQLSALPWPNGLKFLAVSLVTYALMFVSYEFLIRDSWLGRAIFGRH